jgi:putative ATP-binding cassette transporter
MAGDWEEAAGSQTPPPLNESVAAQIKDMADALWTSHERVRIVLLSVALVLVVGATAYGQVKLNAWNQPFYNSLAHKSAAEFFAQLAVFGELAGLLLALNVAQAWLNQETKVILRKGLVSDLLALWLSPLRAFRLSHAGAIGENPDQRIHEDARHLTELTTDLGIGLLQSGLLLLSFVGVLWILSDAMVLSIMGHTFVAPGYMVWCALLYAGIASFLSWRVGRRLVDLNAERYAREAGFRAALVRTNDEIEGVTLFGGEQDERGHLERLFDPVLRTSQQIVLAVTGLTWVTAGAGWLGIVAPIILAAPAYFHNAMSFGQLMMLVGAFNQVQSALQYFVNNFSNIADWLATLLRVATFRRTLMTMDQLGEAHGQIALDETEESSIVIDELEIAATSGCVTLSEPHVTLKPGERVLVIGEAAHGYLLFRAIAGLWPWGSGRIARPPHGSVMFVPTPGYAPPGTLRESLAYPDPPDTYDEARVTEALAAVGLADLPSRIDEGERWDRRLNDSEKQLLAFARVILRRPRWVVFNRAFASLEPSVRERIRAAFQERGVDFGVIYIGQAEDQRNFFSRNLRLEFNPRGQRFKPLAKVEASDPRNTAALSPRSGRREAATS